ncbi:MAG: hypothetical protein M3291_00060 [Actinomycetota bacterium]|nr:hypothetical protein [Actinomycetota bacterium]
MNPSSIIVGALAAGAATGLTDTATTAVNNAYTGLRELVRRRFAAVPAGETALVEHEKAPEVWQAPLAAALEATGADSDEHIIEAAQRVLALVEESRAGGQSVRVIGSQDPQVVGEQQQPRLLA